MTKSIEVLSMYNNAVLNSASIPYSVIMFEHDLLHCYLVTPLPSILAHLLTWLSAFEVPP